MEANNKLGSAAINGIYLSLITIIYCLLEAVLPLGVGIIIYLFKVIKIAIIFYALYYIIKKYAENYETYSYGDGFKYGFLVCFFSSIICTCYYYIHSCVLFRDETISNFEKVFYSIQDTELQEKITEQVINNLGMYTILSSFVSLIIFAVIVPAVVANFTKKENIF